MIASWVAALVSAYLIGAIPTAYLLVKWVKRIDVRAIGSGNVGATNATRALGLRGGIAVFLLDAAKGLIAVLVIAPWGHPAPSTAQRLACGLAAVIGHNFPVFLKFRGGKGVSTTIGALLGTVPGPAGICLLIGLACFFLTRYVSLSSLVASSALPIILLVMRRPRADVALGVIFAGLILARHRANIERLLQGKEHRF